MPQTSTASIILGLIQVTTVLTVIPQTLATLNIIYVLLTDYTKKDFYLQRKKKMINIISSITYVPTEIIKHKVNTIYFQYLLVNCKFVFIYLT